jgi:hypothetical protein
VEKYSGAFGLKLNKGKCVAINNKVNSVIKFTDGTQMPNNDSAEYLGSIINKRANTDEEVKRRIQLASYTWKKLKHFWKNRHLSTNYKLQTYDAVIRSKIVYGLESARMTPTLIKKLVGFQMKGIRQILNLQHPYIVRENSHENVMIKANQKITSEGKTRQISFISDYLLDQAARLAGHVLRSPAEDPLRQVTFEVNKAVPLRPEKLRVGRPKVHWAESTLDRIWTIWKGWQNTTDFEEFDPCDYNHGDTLLEAANLRIF